MILQGLDWTPQKPGNEAAYADAMVFQEFVAVVKVWLAPCMCQSLTPGTHLSCDSPHRGPPCCHLRHAISLETLNFSRGEFHSGWVVHLTGSQG